MEATMSILVPSPCVEASAAEPAPAPRSSRLRKAAAATVALALLSLGQAAVAASYNSKLLPSLSGLGEEGNAFGISNRGEVVGGSMDLDPWFVATHWNAAGRPTSLAPSGNFFTRSVAYGINDAGHIAGYDTDGRALHWQGNSVTVLPSLGGSQLGSVALAINNPGQIAGYSTTASKVSHATVWQNDQPIDLGTLAGGHASFAYAINDAGQVAGGSTTAGSGSAVATLWSGGTAHNLGTLGGIGSTASGINDAGQVVGYNYSATGATRAVIWNGNNGSFLGSLGPTWDQARAVDINNSSQTVGWSTSTTGSSHATLWASGSAIDLNQYLDPALASAGWQLLQAHAINDNGLITGMAFNYNTARGSAFLLTPVPAVPEPAGVVLLATGLCVVGVVAWRARRRSLAAAFA
jgi:probable HAF family extracellular repeat protein